MDHCPRTIVLFGLATAAVACFNPDLVPRESAANESSGAVAAGTDSTHGPDASTGSTGGASDPSSSGPWAESSSGPTDPGSTSVGVDDPDVPVGDCDPWAQSCPVGHKCVPRVEDGRAGWDALTCVPVVADPAQVGEACTAQAPGTTGVDDCAFGAVCWGVDPATLEGTCVGQCMGTPDSPWCESTGTTCVVSNEGVLTLCLPTCDPLLQTCPDAEGCYLQGDEFICVPDSSGGAAQAGTPCQFVNACAPGNTCVQGRVLEACEGPVGCCTPFCDASAAGDPCPAPTEQCRPLVPPVPGFEHVGICAIDP